MPKLHLITYGCQMNEYDSERVAGLLKNERYELTDSPDDADLILLNTCAIREKAEDKVYSQLGTLKRLKAERPGLLIGVMGCMAQLQQERIQQRAPYVDLVFGSPAIARVVAAEGAVAVDLSGDPGRSISALTADDGFHPSTRGHRVIAAAFARALRTG